MKLHILTAGVVLGVFASPAFSATAYFNDFSTAAGAEWSSASLATAPSSEKFLGEFGNTTVTGSFVLPAHSSVTVSFLLYILNSWDGSGSYCCGPDRWKFSMDGADQLDTTFSNTDGLGTQNYPGPYPGATVAARTGAFANNTLGYTYYGDSIYKLSFTVPHVAAALSLSFMGSGLQGLSDESWGIDDVKIDYVPAAAGVPEPSTLVMGAAAGLLVVLRRLRA